MNQSLCHDYIIYNTLIFTIKVTVLRNFLILMLNRLGFYIKFNYRKFKY